MQVYTYVCTHTKNAYKIVLNIATAFIIIIIPSLTYSCFVIVYYYIHCSILHKWCTYVHIVIE